MGIKGCVRVAMAAAVTMAVLGTGPAAGAALPPVSLSATTIAFDGSVTIAGSGCSGSSALVAVNRGDVAYLAAPPTNDAGEWSLAFDGSLFTVPEFTPGLFTVESACNGYGSFEDYDDVSFVVLPPDGAPELDGPLGVSATTVSAGGKVTLVADGMTSAFDVSAFLFSAPVFVGNLPVEQIIDGVAELEITIPADTAPGTHQLVVFGSGLDAQARVLGATITVTAAQGGVGGPGGVGSDTLPATGQASWTHAGIGVSLAIVGLGLTVASTRLARRPRGAHFAR